MRRDLLTMISEAAAMGAASAVGMMQPQGDRISQRRAEAMFGRAFLRRNADRLEVVWNGNRREYSRSQCESVRHGESVAAVMARIEQTLINSTKKYRKNGQEKNH